MVSGLRARRSILVLAARAAPARRIPPRRPSERLLRVQPGEAGGVAGAGVRGVLAVLLARGEERGYPDRGDADAGHARVDARGPIPWTGSRRGGELVPDMV